MSIESEEHPPQGPLSGLRVLDFTWALAGPFGTMQLADLGAEVVKVEHPRVTEKQRGFGPYYEEISTFLFSVNRGKKGICIDLKDPEGQSLDKKLAGQADVLLVPSVETGNALVKMMIYFMGACAAGVVVGGKVPVVITSRSDEATARMASIAAAVVALD